MDASNPTDVALAPSPWTLKGRGYIALLRFTDGGTEQRRFVPESLRGKGGNSPYAWVMFVDYHHSDVGPYHELLFIPGSFAFADGKRHLSISRIFVSSMASVVNGQRNWGIPKDVAQFDVRYRNGGLDQVKVSRDGRVFAELQFRSYPLPLPFWGGLIPASLRTLGQHHQGQTFLYAPRAKGWVRPAKLVSAKADPSVFPDLARARPVLAVEASSFEMEFPVSNILPRL